MTVTVIGCDGAALGAEAQELIARADLLVGSAALLSLTDHDCPRVVLGPLAPALERIAVATRPVVLAGGDPGWFGIVRVLREAGHRCTVRPAASSVATAFARIGVPWDDAAVVSAHGRHPGPAINACRALPSVAVLTAPDVGAVHIARALRGWPRELVVAERLGRADERITLAPSEEIAEWAHSDVGDPHVLLCLDPSRGRGVRSDNQPAAAPATGWALPEAAYAHRDSMITKAEVRALAVARLQPRLGRLVLDVGAGSGAVGIECNRLGAAVVAVERDADACARIRANATTHDARVRVVHAAAPAGLEGLPVADAAFVGGGGVAAVEAVARHGVATVVAAFAALDHALGAHRTLTAHGYRVEGTQLSAARLADLPDGSLRLAAVNPVLVLTAERP